MCDRQDSFLPVTMTDRFSNFNSISYTDDRHELRVTGTKCRLPDTMSGTSKIFISGAVCCIVVCRNVTKFIQKVLLLMLIDFSLEREREGVSSEIEMACMRLLLVNVIELDEGDEGD